MSPHQLAGTLAPERERNAGRQLFAFLGPATLVGVGYMDPGNWATDLEGGARFGYQLLWVLAVSNLIALLLQSLAARLGLVTRLDLAQACRQSYSRPVAYALWLLAELAIVACDLAEVLGSAVALNLLFGIPMAWGAAITAADVFLVLLLQHRGMRKLEAIVTVLVLTIGGCLAAELWLVRPVWSEVVTGFVPRLHDGSLYIAIGILGATVMPHNLYLHSSLVRTRYVSPSNAAVRRALRFNFFDTLLALNVAFLINASILILAADVFHPEGLAIRDLREAHRLLTPLVGIGFASLLFAIALLCAGQSATITGTMAGQIVMEGFLRRRISPVLVRLSTRALAVLPAVFVLALAGEDSTVGLLVATQVVLSLQLPFAIVPLVRFTSDRKLMGSHAISSPVRWLAWTSALFVIGANAWLVAQTIGEAPPPWQMVGAITAVLALALLAHLARARLASPDRQKLAATVARRMDINATEEPS